LKRLGNTTEHFTLGVAWFLSALITFLAPVTFFQVSYQHLRTELVVQTELSANDISELIGSNPILWRYEELRLTELLKRRSKSTSGETRVIYDTNDNIIAKNAIEEPLAHIHISHDIYDAGTIVARIEITRSLWPLLWQTFLVALGSASFSAVLFLTLRILPRRSLRKAYQALSENEEKYRSLHDTMKEGVAQHRVTFDNRGELSSFTVIEANTACAEMLNCSQQELIGKDSLALFGTTFRESLSELLNVFEHGNSYSFEITSSGKGRFYLVTAFSRKPGVITTLFEDTTERKKSEQRIRKMAYSDQLTGLPNRTLFQDRLGQAIVQAEQSGSSLAVFYLDLDRFKIFNDTMGRGTGDQLLIEVSRRLKRQIRVSDTLARMGEDEFCIVATNLAEDLNASYVAQKLVNLIIPPFMIEGKDLHITASIGIAVFPDDGREAETLIKNADLAMYSAKEAGRNTYNFYSPEMNSKAHAHMEMETGMRNALEHEQFFVEFQPIMGADSQTISAAEALVRWNHPTRGRIPPNEFIPFAEETGLILPLGEWILRTVCSKMKQWSDAGLPQIRFSVNVSSKQLEQQNFAEIVREVLHSTGANASQLEIELTESCLVNHAGSNITEVFGLRDAGVSIAIDDFGTGYSSLGYIKTLQIDHIKIDRSFVSDIKTNVHDQAIVEAIIAMSQKLGIQNIAEGVETAEQLDFLKEHGCGEVQGYFFHRPLSVDAFEMLLKEQM